MNERDIYKSPLIQERPAGKRLRVATFNASMEGENYVSRGTQASHRTLNTVLESGSHPQVINIAYIIRKVRPDILLINEFDYTPDSAATVDAFRRNYLARTRPDSPPIDYPYYYSAAVNTGLDSGFDLDRDGRASGRGQDAWGYGQYPGHYGMLLLSRYPVETQQVRSFQHFLWRDLPDNLLTGLRAPDGSAWYPPEAIARFPLSSKSHWDVPVQVEGQRVHLLASHPTPPVFDGPEDRNGRRNHDEIRFWSDYLKGPKHASYLYDDQGRHGGLGAERFVILGDLNSSPSEGDSRREAIAALLSHPLVNGDVLPTSAGAAAARPKQAHAATHTNTWGMRADYVLPSRAGWRPLDSGVYWPRVDEPGAELVRTRASSSDHRLVWVDLLLEPLPGEKSQTNR